ncbi:MAG: ATP synthase F1 subunit delta [Candidatus Omnitrophica bacterium]|nr:ATP synthase F1 subunit delta [Candidatus Omnitrophota bacterium]
MINKDPVSSRYVGAFFELAKERGGLDGAARDMRELGRMLDGEPALRRLLANPDVEAEDKLDTLGRLLQEAWSTDTRAFVHVVLAFDRAELLGQMAAAFQELMDQERRIARVRVRSARPLTESLRDQLRSRLEARQRCTIELEEEIDAGLIGGVQVILDHRLFDGSVRTGLSDLRRRLSSVRVH